MGAFSSQVKVKMPQEEVILRLAISLPPYLECRRKHSGFARLRMSSKTSKTGETRALDGMVMGLPHLGWSPPGEKQNGTFSFLRCSEQFNS